MPQGLKTALTALGVALAAAGGGTAGAAAGLSAGGTADAAAPALLCRAGNPGAERHLDGMCRALSGVLAAATGRKPEILAAGSDKAQAGAGAPARLLLTLDLVAAGPDALKARLSWQGADGQGSGPQLAFSVSDTRLDDRFYGRFARLILRHSNALEIGD